MEARDGESYIRAEYNYSGFKRIFKIGNSINQEKVKALYNQGILEIILEKKDEEKLKPSRLIEVN